MCLCVCLISSFMTLGSDLLENRYRTSYVNHAVSVTWMVECKDMEGTMVYASGENVLPWFWYILLLDVGLVTLCFKPQLNDIKIYIYNISWDFQLCCKDQVKVFIALLCPVLHDPVDCMPSRAVHGILQTGILGWAVSSPGYLLDAGTEPRSPALLAGALPCEPPGQPLAKKQVHNIWGNTLKLKIAMHIVIQ